MRDDQATTQSAMAAILAMAALSGCVGPRALPAGGLELPSDGFAYLIEYPSTDEGNYVIGQIREGYAEAPPYRLLTLLNCRAGVGYYVFDKGDAQILGRYAPSNNSARMPSALEQKISALRSAGSLSDVVNAAREFEREGFQLQFFQRTEQPDDFDIYDTEYRSCKYHYGVPAMNWIDPNADGSLRRDPETIGEMAQRLKDRLQ